MKSKQKTIWIILAIFLISFCMVSTARAESKRKKIREGSKHFSKGDYDASIDKFSEALSSEPESDVINYDMGTAYYKKGEYLKSVEHLQKALLTEDDGLRQKVFYNMGNAMYKAGIEHQDSDINGAVKALEQALSSYESSLALDQDDEDAKYNHDFVKKELERLREMQKKESQTCDNPKDSKGADNSDDSKESKDNSEDENNQSQKGSEDSQKDQSNQQDKEGSGGEPEGNKEKEQDGSQQKDSSKEDVKQGDQGYNSSQDSKNEAGSEQQGTGQKQDQGELSRKEAQMLIENYRQTEEPQGLLKVLKGQATERDVLKDW
ncbi:MAG: hypothetical protein A2Y03_02320 [Omnitrophica WOR_2 bacterium GWF2_38_59]|nr:MAG: hypothetical protein A2Y06_06105 [Omnitrophica WOR_2 bacterium GWA2_37_7]OGX23867.1 MAG: hypothetical protein A2Y03_02320 [Omnitrophica WOR_2 bacterium GWF2_38_59]OGX54443.1 MAG: hypothetical protein A2267_09495 [Omnitrophica WOR_2 bacterium RIFOXYA12_FULL_38_10]OGX56964.1 MAG: hypothetical protein A2447_05630 [Omnitrophica WOR_2 bacterium RIFOXYC2_FULL_38_12]HBG60305.1 hypothetical protein [Candidatus Omnitrophota bacterium]